MKLFQEHEAWVMFKVTAIGEACGWSLLLYGIAAPYYRLPGANFMLPIGGSIHGLLFLAYLGVILAGFTSLNWSWRKAIFAVCMSVIPFATWVFEAWCATKRRAEALRTYRRIMIKPVVEKGHKVLAVQLSTGLDWVIPGGLIGLAETPAQAARRVIFEITGASPDADPVRLFSADSSNTISLYFAVAASPHVDLTKIETRLKQQTAVDEVGFVARSQVPELNAQ